MNLPDSMSSFCPNWDSEKMVSEFLVLSVRIRIEKPTFVKVFSFSFYLHTFCIIMVSKRAFSIATRAVFSTQRFILAGSLPLSCLLVW